MARLARLVVPNHPHHITQRGNRRLETFFSDDDYKSYLELLVEWCGKSQTDIWAYCLMPNHVHLILVPSHGDGLRAALGEAHRRYTRKINFREGWRGHLWQSRFASFPMDEQYLLACARYVELNPVRAKLVEKPEDWAWSSARAHLEGRGDGVVNIEPLLERINDWKVFLRGGLDIETLNIIRSRERTGHALGGDRYLEELSKLLGRAVKPKKVGRPRHNDD